VLSWAEWRNGCEGFIKALLNQRLDFVVRIDQEQYEQDFPRRVSEDPE
jgi:hypothetical protein